VSHIHAQRVSLRRHRASPSCVPGPGLVPGPSRPEPSTGKLLHLHAGRVARQFFPATESGRLFRHRAAVELARLRPIVELAHRGAVVELARRGTGVELARLDVVVERARRCAVDSPSSIARHRSYRGAVVELSAGVQQSRSVVTWRGCRSRAEDTWRSRKDSSVVTWWGCQSRAKDPWRSRQNRSVVIWREDAQARPLYDGTKRADAGYGGSW
jgi:hypothetical protein